MSYAPTQRETTFAEYVRRCLTERYADFRSRARRSEYWYYQLFTIGLNLALQLLSSVLFLGDGTPTLFLAWQAFLTLISLALLIPGLAVHVRRLHDIGKSGLNLLWWLLPIIGWIVVIVYLCRDSEPGPNRYGPNPKYADPEDLIGHLQA